MPNGGYQADTGQLSAGANAYSQEGGALGQAAGKLTPAVAAGQVGHGFPDVAGKYAEAFGRFKDGLSRYGALAGEFGGTLGSAAQRYSTTEQDQRRAIPGQG